MKIEIKEIDETVCFFIVDGRETMVWDAAKGELFWREPGGSFTKVGRADRRSSLETIAGDVGDYVVWRRAGGLTGSRPARKGRQPNPRQRASARR